jgi:hypothetical protein
MALPSDRSVTKSEEVSPLKTSTHSESPKKHLVLRNRKKYLCSVHIDDSAETSTKAVLCFAQALDISSSAQVEATGDDD